jgi:hypothetical protein
MDILEEIYKATPQESRLAERIVDLEINMPGLKTDADEKARAANQLRKRHIAGHDVSAEELAAADSAATEASKNLDAARGLIVDLQKDFLKMAEEQRHSLRKKCRDRATELYEEHERRRVELLKKFAGFFVEWIKNEGCHRGGYRFELNGTVNGERDVIEIFRPEVDRLLSPDYDLGQKSIQGLQMKARQFDEMYEGRLRLEPEEFLEKTLRETRTRLAKEAEEAAK